MTLLKILFFLSFFFFLDKSAQKKQAGITFLPLERGHSFLYLNSRSEMVPLIITIMILPL